MGLAFFCCTWLAAAFVVAEDAQLSHWPITFTSFLHVLRGERALALNLLKEAEALVTGNEASGEQQSFLAWGQVGDVSRALKHYERLAELDRASRANPESLERFEILAGQLRARLLPAAVEARVPRSLTEDELRAELRGKLSEVELALVEYPLASTQEIQAWSENLTKGVQGDRDKARAIFDALCARSMQGSVARRAAAKISDRLAVQPFDILIRDGDLYDGTGAGPVRADVGIRGDRIALVGDSSGRKAKRLINAQGLAVAPGFINMLSWSTESMIQDGRSVGELMEGVTTQIFGEGESMGPLNEAMKRDGKANQSLIHYDYEWTTLGEYLAWLEKRGVSQNVASFVGATTVREHVLGHADRAPAPEELERMRGLVRQAMEEGALGVGSSLIYAPAFYAKTDELVELCKVAARFGGMYISHLRSEGDRLHEALDELLEISRRAGIPAEIYHLKAAGRENWPKLDAAIAKIEKARAEGLRITADMYTYPAASTGLDACVPPWAHEGGNEALWGRLKYPATRARIADEIRAKSGAWENLYRAAGSPEGIIIVDCAREENRPLLGKTLAEIAKGRGRDPVETMLDILLADRSRVDSVYFLMSEENVSKQVKLPWASFCSDAASMAPEEPFIKTSTHPRAYGSFARLLGKYVRDEKALSLGEAVRRLSSFPAENLKLRDRGLVREGWFADVVVFDPAVIADRATYKEPHQYAVGVNEVFVNGVEVIRDGVHTGAKPGRALWGPGKKN